VNTRATAASRPTILLAAIAALALSLIWVVSPALGTHVPPVYVDSENANSCEDLGLDGAGWNLDASDVQSGTHTYTNGAWSITITADAAGADGKNFSFSNASPPVLKLAVKAGDGYYLYDYSPGGATADTGLITPNTQGNDPEAPQAGLSHFFICFGEPGESESESQSQSESESESQSQSGEQSVAAGTGTPAESQPDTAMSFGGSNPLPTVAFGLILLASLAGLAFANVKASRSRS